MITTGQLIEGCYLQSPEATLVNKFLSKLSWISLWERPFQSDRKNAFKYEMTHFTESARKFAQKTFVKFEPGTDLIKRFWLETYILFCKLNIFKAMQQAKISYIKRPSLQKSVSKFTPKQFYEIYPRFQSYKTFLRKLNHTGVISNSYAFMHTLQQLLKILAKLEGNLRWYNIIMQKYLWAQQAIVLSLADLSSLVWYLRVRPGTYPRVEYLKGPSLG